tara:strand:+ start:313 stop:969 length:657 start_codon:yes stop_codon:yes gene_type:complete
MRYKVALLALILVSSTLAGCTGDPDGGGNDEFDAETLQGMIESGLQDFMNNTTVEITNNYYGSSQTGSATGNGSGNFGQFHVVDHEFSMTISNTNTSNLLIYEISVPDGMGIACIDRSASSSAAWPIVYIDPTSAGLSQSSSNLTWSTVNEVYDLNLDGVRWGCDSGFIGGNGDQILQLHFAQNWYNWPLMEPVLQDGDTVDLRLLFTYQLIPVVVHV